MTTFPAVRGPDGAFTPPVRPDGERYRYELIDGSGRWRVYADEKADLVADLIPGYAELPDEPARVAARTQALVGARVLAQAGLINDTGTEGCTPEQRDLLLGERDGSLTIEQPWTAPVPLVLITGFYEPYQRRARPEGDIVWLDSGSEATFLAALVATGVVVLAERA